MVKIYSTTYINSIFAIRLGLSSSFRPCFFSTRNGIPSCFLFRGMVQNRNPIVCFYFCTTERNSELFFLPRKGSEGNSESMPLFLFHGTEFRKLFSLPRKGSERNSRGFCSAEQPEFRRKWAFVPSIPSSAELFFCRKFPTLSVMTSLTIDSDVF